MNTPGRVREKPRPLNDTSPLLHSRRGPLNSRGSILLITLILSTALSVLVTLATDVLLLDRKTTAFFETSMDLLYLAESGLSHAQAYCKSEDGSAFFNNEEMAWENAATDENNTPPFDRWLNYGDGMYLLEAYHLNAENPVTPYLIRDDGILFVASARSAEGPQRKKLCLLVEKPPSCKGLAGWEPE